MFYSFGIFFLGLFKENFDKYSFFDSFFVGFCFIGTMLNLWSIFLPTNIYALVALIIISILVCYKHRNLLGENLKKILLNIKSNKLVFLLILSIILIHLLYSVGIPKNYDSYLYHINAIQWIEKYAVVPGLANLHDRFGLNSSQFVLSSAFSFNAIYNQYIFIINSLCFLIFLVWIVLYAIYKKDVFSIVALLFGYFFFWQYYSDISSPSTDLVPNLLFGFLMLKMLFNPTSIHDKGLLYIAISFFIATFKLSFFPLIILGMIAIYYQKRNYFYLLKTTSLFVLIFILPYIIRNIFLTGYLIYPLASIDVFNFDWEVSQSSVVTIHDAICSWGKIPTKIPREVLDMSLNQWFPLWWENGLLRNNIVFAIAVLSPLFLMFYYLTNKNSNKTNTLIAFILSFVIFVFWFITAPDIRFSFSVLLILCAFPIIFIKKYISKFTKIVKFLLILFGLFFFYDFFSTGDQLFLNEYKKYSKIENYLYLPNDVYYVKYNRSVAFNQVDYKASNGSIVNFFEPKNKCTQCFDKFPCSWHLDYHLKLRGESLGDGFSILNK